MLFCSAANSTANDSSPHNEEEDFYIDECDVLTTRGEIKSLHAQEARGLMRATASDHAGCKLLSKSHNSSKSTDSSSSSAYASAESLTPTNDGEKAKSNPSPLGFDDFGHFANILDYKNQSSNSKIAEQLIDFPDEVQDLQESIENQECKAEDYPLEYESEFRRQVIPEDDARTRAIVESSSKKGVDLSDTEDELTDKGVEASPKASKTVPGRKTKGDSKVSAEEAKKSSSTSSVSNSKELKKSSSASSQEEFRIEKVVCDWIVPLSKKEKAERRQNQVESFKSNTKNQFKLDRKKFVPSGLADYHDKKEYYSKFGTHDDEIASILFRDEVKSTKRKAKQVTKELKSVVRSLRLSDSSNPPKTPVKTAASRLSQSHSHPSIGTQSVTILHLKSSASFTVSPTVSSTRYSSVRKQQAPPSPVAPRKILKEIAVSSSPKRKYSPHIRSQGSKESLISDSSSVETLVSDSTSCLVGSNKNNMHNASELENEAVGNSPIDEMNLSLPDIEEMLKSDDITFSSLASQYCSKVKGLDLSSIAADLIQRDAENPPRIYAFLPSVNPCRENLGQEQQNDKALRDSVQATSPFTVASKEASKTAPVRSSPQPPSPISTKRPSTPFSRQLMSRILASLPLTQPMKRKQGSQGDIPKIVVTPPSPLPAERSTPQAKKDSKQTLGSRDTLTAATVLDSPLPARRDSQQTVQSYGTLTSDSLPQFVQGTHSSATASESGKIFHFHRRPSSISTPPSAHEVTTQTSQFGGMISIAIIPPTPPSEATTSMSSIIPEQSSDPTRLTVPPVDLRECVPPPLKRPGSPCASGRFSPGTHKRKKRGAFLLPSSLLTVPPVDTKAGVTPSFKTPGSPPPQTRPFTHPPTKFDGSRMQFTFPSTKPLPTVIVTPPTPPPIEKRNETRFSCPLPVLVELEEGNTTSEDTITLPPPLSDCEGDDGDDVATISVGCITPPSPFNEDHSPDANAVKPSSKRSKTRKPQSPCEDKQVSRLSLSSVDLRSLKSASIHSAVTSSSLSDVPAPQVLARWEHGIIPAIVMTPPTPPNDSGAGNKAPRSKVEKSPGEAVKFRQQSPDISRICTSDGKVTNEDAQFLSKLHCPIQTTPDFSDIQVDTCLALASIPTPSPQDSQKGGSPNLKIFKFAPENHIADVKGRLGACGAVCHKRKNSSQSAPFLKGQYGLPSLEIAYQASLEDFEVDSLTSPPPSKPVASPRMSPVSKVGPSPLVTHSIRSNAGITSPHIFASKSTPSSMASSPFQSPHPLLSKPTPAHCALSPQWDTGAVPARLGTPHVISPRQVFHFEPAPEDSASVHSASVPSLSAENPTTCPIIILSNQRANSSSEEDEYSFYVPFKPLLNLPESPTIGSINSSGSSASTSSSSSEYSDSFHHGSRKRSSFATLDSSTPREKNRRSSLSTGRSTSRKSVQFALSTKPGSDCSVCKENSTSSSLTHFEDLRSPSSMGSPFSLEYNYRDFACSSDEVCSTAAEKSPSFYKNERDYKLAKRLQTYELLSSSVESIPSSENSLDPMVLSDVLHYTSPGTMKKPIAPSSVRIEFQDSVPSLRSSLFAGKRKNDENGEFKRTVMLKSQMDHSPKPGSISPRKVVCRPSFSSIGSADEETDFSSIRDIVHRTKNVTVDSSVYSDDDEDLDLMSENSYRSGNVSSIHATNSSLGAASVEPYFLQGQDSAYGSVHSRKAETVTSEATSSGPSVESYLRPLKAQFAKKCESVASRSAPSVLSSPVESESSLPENGSSSIEKLGDIIVEFSKKCEKASSAPSIRTLLSSVQHQPTCPRHRPSVYFRPSVKLENAIATAVDLKHGLEATIAILSSTTRGNTLRRRFSVTAIDSPLLCHPPPPTPVSSEKDLISAKITMNEELQDIDNAHKKYLKVSKVGVLRGYYWYD